MALLSIPSGFCAGCGQGLHNTFDLLGDYQICKFTVGLRNADVRESKRLRGFAAIERSAKGPVRQARQAPALNLVHLKELHRVLETGSCLTDRLGAGTMLVAIYARARWSDFRNIHHVEFERGQSGILVLYTTEHKTANLKSKKDQYLPFICPAQGVTHGKWIDTFLEVYALCGLDINRIPLGPLLPAPRESGGFMARPLTTSEASVWLRALLQDIPGSKDVRSHLLKATLLAWAAQAGLDKETRSVLGHHCSAVSGSEVVYSRQLQTRAIRKLQMLIKYVRMGLSCETFDEALKFSRGEEATRFPMTPLPQPATPAGAFVSCARTAEAERPDLADDPLGGEASEGLHVEGLDLAEVPLGAEEEQAADDLSLFEQQFFLLARVFRCALVQRAELLS